VKRGSFHFGRILTAALLVAGLSWLPTPWARAQEESGADGESASQTLAEGSVGLHQDGVAYDGPLGQVDTSVDAGASGELSLGEDGLTGEFQAGVSAEVNAESATVGVGDENIGASGHLNAQIEALVGAEGSIQAQIDENGITLGAEASAGAYVSAEVSVDFEAHVFGIQTNVHAYVEGHAGVVAHGEASVSIGYDGTISFQLGAGLSIGLGASVGIEFSVDASQLIEQLGLADMAELIVWLDEFIQDPEGTISQLIDDAQDAVVDAASDALTEAVDNVINDIFSWFGGKPEDASAAVIDDERVPPGLPMPEDEPDEEDPYDGGSPVVTPPRRGSAGLD